MVPLTADTVRGSCWWAVQTERAGLAERGLKLGRVAAAGFGGVRGGPKRLHCVDTDSQPSVASHACTHRHTSALSPSHTLNQTPFPTVVPTHTPCLSKPRSTLLLDLAAGSKAVIILRPTQSSDCYKLQSEGTHTHTHTPITYTQLSKTIQEANRLVCVREEGVGSEQ